MLLRELKEEFKQTDGDPAIEGKMGQVRHVRWRRHMIAVVPKATVVNKGVNNIRGGIRRGWHLRQ